MSHRISNPNPKAKRIASELRACPALLSLSIRTLAGDVIARYGCGYKLAFSAVMLARGGA